MFQLTAGRLTQLRAVQDAINRRRYVPDVTRYDRPDFWTVIDERGGDCEDFALGKRKMLLDLGFPVEALRLAICVTETGEGHAVLTVDGVVDGQVRTLVLDNRYRDVKDWHDLPYRWIKRQAAGRYGWVAIKT